MLKKSIASVAVSIAAIAIIAGLVFDRDEVETRVQDELSGRELILRDGRLYSKASGRVFDGILAEDYAPQKPRLRIEIRDGRSHGISRRFYENGRLEVEQEYVAGVASGTRTQWYANGKKKSEAELVYGKVEGTYVKWHENGQKAVEVQMAKGQRHGLSLAWHASGLPKERAELERGRVVTRFLWEDADA